MGRRSNLYICARLLLVFGIMQGDVDCLKSPEEGTWTASATEEASEAKVRQQTTGKEMSLLLEKEAVSKSKVRQHTAGKEISLLSVNETVSKTKVRQHTVGKVKTLPWMKEGSSKTEMQHHAAGKVRSNSAYVLPAKTASSSHYHSTGLRPRAAQRRNRRVIRRARLAGKTIRRVEKSFLHAAPEMIHASANELSKDELKLTIATGNLGGGSPQPEFLGGNWDTSGNGAFERLLGLMALTTRAGKCIDDTEEMVPAPTKDKPKKKDRIVEEKFVQRYFTENDYKCIAGESGLQIVLKKGDKTVIDALPKTAADIFGSFDDMKEALKHLGGKVPTEGLLKPKDGTVDLAALKLKDVFADEFSTGLFSGPEGCLKERLAFPYFGSDFMHLVTSYETHKTGAKGNKTKGSFLQMYLKDLRGTHCLLLSGHKSRVFNEGSFCKLPAAERGALFDNKHKIDWPSLALWDIYVVKAYSAWLPSQTKTMKDLTVKVMSGPDEKKQIQRIAEHFVKEGNADLFFIQEVGTVCASSKGNKGWHCGKAAKPDAAIFLSPKAGTLVEDATQAANDKYNEIRDPIAKPLLQEIKDMENELKQIEEKKEGAAKKEKPNMMLDIGTRMKDGKGKNMPAEALGALAYVHQPKGVANSKMIGNTGGTKVALAVAEIGEAKTKVLLVSAHPDSDGLGCAFQLYLLREVFDSLKGEMQLKSMIVGMDANVQTDDDYKDKLKKSENGYNYAEFQKVVDGIGASQDPTPKPLGFTALWPPLATVHKQRTFLQAQLKKAAKHDKVMKDILFIYPPESAVLDGTVEVINNLAEPKYRDEMFPKEDWPMDHFVSKASVKLNTEAKVRARRGRTTVSSSLRIRSLFKKLLAMAARQ